MKKNNKGFTLIELLAVVVILLAISVMAISSISAAIERNKSKQDETKIRVIVSYAEAYYDSHKNSLGGRNVIKLNELDLSEDEITDASGNRFEGCITFESGGRNFTYVEDIGICS